MNLRQARIPRLVVIALAAAVSIPMALLAGCDQESSTSKTSSSKVVDTPEGKKRVTETTETTTTKEKKDGN